MPLHLSSQRERRRTQATTGLTWTPGKVMEYLIMKTISRHVKNKKIIVGSQHGFSKERNICVLVSIRMDLTFFLVDNLQQKD